MKLVRETQKILDDRTIAVTATAVRIPTSGGHSEAVNVEFEQDFDLGDVRKILSETNGVTVQDNPEMNTGSLQFAGYGFGLPMSRAFVRFLGGEVTLQNMPGFGTATHVTLNVPEFAEI